LAISIGVCHSHHQAAAADLESRKNGASTPQSMGFFTNCTIRSYLETLRKQGVDLLHALIQSFQGEIPQPTTG
jgi:hypothetical protein